MYVFGRRSIKKKTQYRYRAVTECSVVQCTSRLHWPLCLVYFGHPRLEHWVHGLNVARGADVFPHFSVLFGMSLLETMGWADPQCQKSWKISISVIILDVFYELEQVRWFIRCWKEKLHFVV
jgi:hypothetical protein